MNWLGQLVQAHITENDSVLDVGCGIMGAIEGLNCKSYLGCDIHKPYLEVLKTKVPTIQIRMDELDRFMDDSYDVVLCLDVLEHLEEPTALKAIGEMKRICRKKVIIFTPNKFATNEEAVSDSWGLGYNEHQRHLIVLKNWRLKEMGFKLNDPSPENGNLGVYAKG